MFVPRQLTICLRRLTVLLTAPDPWAQAERDEPMLTSLAICLFSASIGAAIGLGSVAVVFQMGAAAQRFTGRQRERLT